MTLEFLWQGGIFLGLLFGCFLLLAVAVKGFEVWRTRNWVPAGGRVIAAKVVARAISSAQNTGGKQTGNFAEITYEYFAEGRKLHASRVSLTPPVPDTMVEATLARYPVGSEVTVYYNPANPERAVLERNWPRGLTIAVLVLFGIIGLLAFGVPWLLTGLEEKLAESARNPGSAGAAIGLGAMGAFLLLLGTAMRRHAAAARKWPSVEGKIVTSVAEAFDKHQKGRAVPARSYRAKVVYSYSVNGHSYTSDRIVPGTQFSGSVVRIPLFAGPRGGAAPPWVESTVKRYPQGAKVKVFHNPANPSESVLEHKGGTGAHPLQWVAGALFVIAVVIAVQ